MKKLTLACCLFLLSYITFAQDANYTPTTPEVASMGKFVETPVGYYSGIPNISIPIYTLKEGELSIPVSLSYHSGGNKVEETASWVGMGWNLNAGGSITRVVRGFADDDSGGYLYTTNTVSDFLTTEADALATGNASALNTLVGNALDQVTDYEPDVYHYNFPGFSGSFFFSQSGDVITMPHADIQIETILDANNRFKGWILKDPSGTTYYFGTSKDETRTAYERLIVSQALIANKNITFGHINGWHLMEVEDANEKKKIDFFYTSNIYETCTRSGQEMHINVTGPQGGGLKPITYFENTISSSKISAIQSSNEKIEFELSDTPRTDLPADYALEKIKLSDADDVPIKEFRLTYENVGITGSISTVPCAIGASTAERSFRMFLQSVQEYSGDGSKALNPYLFDYNSQLLPEKFSYAQDFWGYYNGMLSNNNLIPSFTLDGTRFEESDRTSDPELMKAGILERITYPTKGSTEYDFGVSTSGQLSFAQTIAPRVTVPIVQTSTTEIINEVPGPSIKFYSESFTVEAEQYIDDILFTRVALPVGCTLLDRDCGVEILLRNDDSSFTEFITNDQNILVSPDDYVLEVTLFPQTDGSYKDFQVWLEGEQYDMQSITTDGVNYAVGGLRIEQIIQKDADGSTALVKTYEYDKFSDPGTSSGGITSTPIFIENDVPVAFTSPTSYGDVISSTSNSTFVTTRSNYVGYENVTEYFGTPSDNIGKIEYEFSFSMDDESAFGNAGLEQFGLRYPPRAILEWLRGNLEKKRIFKRKPDGTYELHRSVENEYIYYRNSSPLDLFKEDIKGISVGSRNDARTYSSYSTLSEWFKLDHTITTTIEEGGSLIIRIEYLYNEDELKHVIPIEEKAIHSAEESYTTKYHYPQDLPSPTAAESALLTDFRIGIPIKTETFKNLSLISTQYTVYDHLSWPGLNLPAKVQTVFGIESADNPYVDRLIYHEYDSQGNPTEVSGVDGVHTVYIWGYGQMYPIAKIANSTYSDVASVLGADLALLNGSTLTNSEIQSKIQSLRTNFSMEDSQVYTYLYEPGIGLKSSIDPNGTMVSYNYDEFSRLSKIFDNDNNLLQEITYQYKGQ